MNKNGTPKRHHLMRLLAGLPLDCLYLLSDLAYPIIYYIIRYRRRLVRENLRCSFPEKSEQEILRIEKAFYRNFCDVFVEAFKCLNISDEEMRRRVEVCNCELPERLAAEGKNIFMLLGHCGCWEWYQEVGERYSNPKKGAEIYKHIKNKYFASLMHEIRSRWNTKQIEMQQTVRTLLGMSADGEPFLCGFIQDQVSKGMKLKDVTLFMNQPIAIVPGAEELAKKVNAELVYLDIEKTSRGHYRLTFCEMTIPQDLQSKPFPLSVLFFQMLEQTIRRQPEIWLWSHNQWRKNDLVTSNLTRLKNLFRQKKGNN
ncbi:MAG: lysophospholipid acyltransferase family protein [Bacteroidaceae bacterium]|nr:lysophospholipid acyltransferase family protein [Bacteroidaceae bacterium]